MVNIFLFDDFRVYLKCYFKEEKYKNRQFSYRLFAQRTGFDNRLLGWVLKGTCKLSTENALKLSDALKHTRNEKKFFITLVSYTQAETEPEREFHHSAMVEEKKENNFQIRNIDSDKKEFYSQWYHSAVRSIIGLVPFNGDHKGLGQMLSPYVSETEIKDSVQLLERLGLIIRNEKGTYQIADKHIITGRTISEVIKSRFHSEFITLAKMALINVPPENRKALSATIGISKETFIEIQNETETFIRKISTLANSDRNADRVYQCQLLLYPLSETVSPIQNKEVV